MFMMKVTGVKNVVRNMDGATKRVGVGLHQGLVATGLFIQRESQILCPIEFGLLRNSAFTRATGEGAFTEVEVGYTAGYAVYVHENLDARHAPGTSAKFLEIPVKQYRPEMLKLIKAEVRFTI